MATNKATFVSPHDHPAPPCRAARRPTAKLFEEIEELISHCQTGHLYEVEDWIADGKPLQLDFSGLKPKRKYSALQMAIDQRNHSIARLLLVNGYRLDLDPYCPLEPAMNSRADDLIELFLTWGSDYKRVSPETLFNSYDSRWFERFAALGYDLVKDHELSGFLGSHTSNRPLYGYVKRHRTEDPRLQQELDMGLARAIGANSEKAVHLCLWAGANPHAIPERNDEDDCNDLHSAIVTAVSYSSPDILALLPIDPALDDFDQLFECAGSAQTMRYLADIGLPSKWSQIILRHLQRLSWREPTIGCLEMLFELGGRMADIHENAAKDIYRDIVRLNDSDFHKLHRLMRKSEHCDPSFYALLFGSKRSKERINERRQ
jgi:hypothetical protein